MELNSTAAWLAAFGPRAGEDGTDTDLADMGTAFGLNASMLAPAEPSPAPIAVPAAPHFGWERRVVRRSGL
jgi:hypothetical protein